MPVREPFQYAALRVVPRVERGEAVNAGVVLFCRPLRFLGARTQLDEALLAALAPGCDPAEVRAQLDDDRARRRAASRRAGAIAALPQSERFHWLVAPASTIVQPWPGPHRPDRRSRRASWTACSPSSSPAARLMMRDRDPARPGAGAPAAADGARALLLLGHGAGGGVAAPDLVRRPRPPTPPASPSRWSSSPTAWPAASRRRPPHQLDAAWLAVVDALRGDAPAAVRRRSSGARVACRTAAGTGAAGVLCLAFPLHPPGRPGEDAPGELEAVEVPVLIVRARATRSGCRPRPPAARSCACAATTA